MPSLHGGDDRLQCLRIMGITGKDLIAQREAVKRHHQRDAHLLAVRAMIAGVAALCLWVTVCLAFKVCTRDVIEKHLVLDREQLAATPRQMCLESDFILEQMIKGAVEA